MTVFALAQRVQQLMGCQHIELDVRDTARGEIRSQYLSAAKARQVLSWQPGYDLDAGLRETIEWYRELLAD